MPRFFTKAPRGKCQILSCAPFSLEDAISIIISLKCSKTTDFSPTEVKSLKLFIMEMVTSSHIQWHEHAALKIMILLIC